LRLPQAQARAGKIGSPEIVYDKELDSKGDALAQWAKPLKGTLFLPPEAEDQIKLAEIADYVQGNPRFKPQWVAPFLAGAVPWLIAYARARGGRIVTFEKPEPLSTKPKIPDIADRYDVKCLNVWDMLSELGFRA